MDWQPIETAPRDRKPLILYFPKYENNSGLGEMILIERYPVSFPREPTHWMPLPASPK